MRARSWLEGIYMLVLLCCWLFRNVLDAVEMVQGRVWDLLDEHYSFLVV